MRRISCTVQLSVSSPAFLPVILKPEPLFFLCSWEPHNAATKSWFFFLAWAFLWWELVSTEEVVFVFALFPVAFEPTVPSVSGEEKVYCRTFTKPDQCDFSYFSWILLLTKFLTQGSHLRLAGLLAQINYDIWQLKLGISKEGPGTKTLLGNYTLTIWFPIPPHDSLDSQKY